MSNIPITALTPAIDPPRDKAIRGVVTLFWPYSSSTRQCAFLLADPDFRLRHKQGQVRVRFTGASAEAVATSRVGIGDEVVLRLNGGSWEDDPEATRTPGKSVAGELLFRRKLQLIVARDGADVVVNVDAPMTPPRSVEQGGSIFTTTPLPKSVSRLRENLDGAMEAEPGYVYTSPAFVKRLRLSGESLLDSAFDPFIGETMDVDDEDGRQRTSFGRGVQWRYAAKTPSPTKDTFATSQQSNQESPSRLPPITERTLKEQKESAEGMPPPPRPVLQLSQTTPLLPESTMMVDEGDGPRTPKLNPIESPTLPLPSPFPTEGFSHSLSDLQSPEGINETQTARLSEPQSQNQCMLDDVWTEHQLKGEQYAHAELPLESVRHSSPDPETLTRTPLTPNFGFGFDGAFPSAVPTRKISPQDVEKQRVMTQTFRSLFGFTSASQRQDRAQESTIKRSPDLSELEKQRLEASNQVDVRPRDKLPTGSPTTTEINERSMATTTPPPTEQHEFLQPRSRVEPEIIEIGSSSEEEGKSDSDEEVSTMQPSSVPHAASLRFKSPVIPDTYQDSQADDVMVNQQSGEQTTLSESSQDALGTLERQLTDESMLQTFIEQDHFYPTLPTEEVLAEDAAEHEVEATPPEAQLSSPAAPVDQSIQQPSYPSLPLSPSNSQPIHDMASQATLEIPDTMGSVFPPTPQLTQAESSNNLLQEMLPTQMPVSQEELATEQYNQQVETAEREAQSSTKQVEAPAIQSEVDLQDSQPSEQIQAEVEPQWTQQADSGRITRAKAKKAASNRVSIIPDAISTYFSQRRSNAVGSGAEAHDIAFTAQDVSTNGHVETETKSQQLSNGFSTALSYFTPLSRLDSLLNPSMSQQAFGSANTVDVFAVVTNSTTEPARAKGGPKDYYTIFRITDDSLSPQTTRVEVFRPFKSTLPAAKEGDVILLRAFVAKSRNRQPYLISSDASAWCVFTQPSDKNKPAWARKAGEQTDGGGEKMSGPPVEFGQEERDHANDLFSWWGHVRLEKTNSNDGHENHDDGMNGMNGRVLAPVATKL